MKKLFAIMSALLAGIVLFPVLVRAEEIIETPYNFTVSADGSKTVVLYGSDSIGTIKMDVVRNNSGDQTEIHTFSKTEEGSLFIVLRVKKTDGTVVYTDTLETDTYQPTNEWRKYTGETQTKFDFVLHEVKSAGYQDLNLGDVLDVYRWVTAGKSYWKDDQSFCVNLNATLSLKAIKDSTYYAAVKNCTQARWLITRPDGSVEKEGIGLTMTEYFTTTQTGLYKARVVFYRVDKDGETLIPWNDTLYGEFMVVDFKITAPLGVDGRLGNPYYYDTMPYCAFGLPEDMEMGLAKDQYFIQVKLGNSGVYDTISDRVTANGWVLPEAKWEAAAITAEYVYTYFYLYQVTSVAGNGEISASQIASLSASLYVISGKPVLDWYRNAQTGEISNPLSESYNAFSGVKTRVSIKNGTLSQAEGGSMLKLVISKRYLTAPVYETYIASTMLPITLPTLTTPGEYTLTFQLQRHKGMDTVDWEGVKLTHTFTISGEDPDKKVYVTFAPDGGEFIDSVRVALSCRPDSATIYYRIDTTGEFLVYTDTLTVKDTTVIEAFAKAKNEELPNSDTLLRVFTKHVPVKLPSVVFNPAGGSFDSTVKVALSCANTASSIYYRKDTVGEFTRYTGELTLDDTTYVDAYAAAPYDINSDTVRYLFNVAQPVPEPTVYPTLSLFTAPEEKYEPEDIVLIRVQVVDAFLRQNGPDAKNASVKLNIFEGNDTVFTEEVLAITYDKAEFSSYDFEGGDFAGFHADKTYRFEFTLYHNTASNKNVWLDEKGAPVQVICQIEVVPQGTLPKPYEFEWAEEAKDTVNIHNGYGELSFKVKVKKNTDAANPYEELQIVACYFYKGNEEWLEREIIMPDADGAYTFDSEYLEDAFEYAGYTDYTLDSIKEGSYTLKFYLFQPDGVDGMNVLNTLTWSFDVVDIAPVIPDPEPVKLPSVKVTPNGGDFVDFVKVSLRCDSAQAAIYYRIAETAEYVLYNEPFSIFDTTVVEAFAHIDGELYINSDTVVVTFNVDNGPIPERGFSVEPGRVVMTGILGDTVSAQLHVLGGGLEEDVTIDCPQGSGFYCEPERLAAEAVCSPEGTSFTAYYNGSRLADSVQITLRSGSFEETVWLVAVMEDTVTTNILRNELSGVKLYPNPANGAFNVDVPVKADVEIFTSAGVCIRRESAVEGRRSYAMPAAGIYFVRFTADKQTAVKRVVVR